MNKFFCVTKCVNASFLIGIIWVCVACSSSPCPITECPCQPEVCDMCEDEIAKLDDSFCDEFLFDASGYHKLVEGFHQQTHQSGSAKEVMDQVDMYFDFSDGMNYKVTAAEQENRLLTDLVNITSGEKLAYFRLQEEQGKEIESLQAGQVGNIQSFVRNADNYQEAHNYAPLNVAVQKIVDQHDRQSILITDGELATRRGGVDPGFAWAKQSFNKWLREGNRIDFIVKKIKDPKRAAIGRDDERLFFIFFTPRLLANKEKNMIESFLEATEDVNKDDSYTHLKFTLNDYRLEKADKNRAVQEAGLNSTFVDWVVDYSLKTDIDQGYEHIHIEDQEGFKQFLMEFEMGEYDDSYKPEYKERNKLMYDLIFTNEFVNYQVADLDVKVQDFSGPFRAWQDFLRCERSTSITFEDEEGQSQTYWCNPTGNCENNDACSFDPNVQKGKPLKEVFALHDEVAITVGENEFRTAQIAIKPSENFNVDEMYEMGACKIELFIKDVTYSESRQTFDVLTWKYKNKDNIGLSESIRLAMRDLKPQNRLIYTYYLTFGLP